MIGSALRDVQRHGPQNSTSDEPRLALEHALRIDRANSTARRRRRRRAPLATPSCGSRGDRWAASTMRCRGGRTALCAAAARGGRDSRILGTGAVRRAAGQRPPMLPASIGYVDADLMARTGVWDQYLRRASTIPGDAASARGLVPTNSRACAPKARPCARKSVVRMMLRRRELTRPTPSLESGTPGAFATARSVGASTRISDSGTKKRARRPGGSTSRNRACGRSATTFASPDAQLVADEFADEFAVDHVGLEGQAVAAARLVEVHGMRAEGDQRGAVARGHRRRRRGWRAGCRCRCRGRRFRAVADPAPSMRPG